MDIKPINLTNKRIGILLTVLLIGSSAMATERAETNNSQDFKISKNGVSKIASNLYVPFPRGGKVTPQREPNIRQQDLLMGKYPLGVVLEAGQNQFNVPFDPQNGHGEGDKGPRS